MSTRRSSPLCLAGVLAVTCLVISCEGRSPTAPLPQGALSIAGLFPKTGPVAGGTVVYITGQGFGSGVTATLGGAPLSISATSSTQITATTPAHAAAAVDLVVTNTEGKAATLPAAFVYANSLAVTGITPLAVTGIIPHTGPASGGTRVEITGTGFGVGAWAVLDPTGLGGAPITITSITDTTITGITRFQAPGLVNVTVVNPGGQRASLTNAFTYTIDPLAPPPSVSSVSPNTGSPEGKGYVTVTGSGFQPGATVAFGAGEPSKYARYTASTSLILYVAPHELGTVDVIVTNPDGKSGTLPGGYTYAPRESFDFNGTWKGGVEEPSHTYPEVTFTIEDNAVVAISCGATALAVPVPPPVNGGEFSYSVSGRVVLSGKILQPTAASGTVDIFPCVGSWYATKR